MIVQEGQGRRLLQGDYRRQRRYRKCGTGKGVWLCVGWPGKGTTAGRKKGGCSCMEGRLQEPEEWVLCWECYWCVTEGGIGVTGGVCQVLSWSVVE